uniref:Uncharacterized protein n=1 Tax=Acrobeloides nanus TaxID=290746 RepID=A0A914D5W1_9BILA
MTTMDMGTVMMEEEATDIHIVMEETGAERIEIMGMDILMTTQMEDTDILMITQMEDTDIHMITQIEEDTDIPTEMNINTKILG